VLSAFIYKLRHKLANNDMQAFGEALFPVINSDITTHKEFETLVIRNESYTGQLKSDSTALFNYNLEQYVSLSFPVLPI
jgi:hypothetical protein